MNDRRIHVPQERIAEFCRKWRVRELSLFGSVIRDDFRAESDVDVLVSFEENSRISLWHMAEMVLELEALFGRKVDLVEKEALRNPYRKHAILTGRNIVYAA